MRDTQFEEQTHSAEEIKASEEIARLHVLEEVLAERIKQGEKWGQQNHSPIEWIAILIEEVGEASREAVDHRWAHLDANSANISKSLSHTRISKLKAYRKELV